MAWGLWRMGIVAFLMGFFLVFAAGMINGDSRDASGDALLPPGFALLLFMGLACFGFSTAAASLGILLAFRRRIRIWLGPEADWAYESKSWPPHTVALRPPAKNQARTIIISALITMAFGSILFFLIFLFPLAVSQNKSAMPIFLVGLVMILIGLPVAILMLLEIARKTMIAATPEACWASTGDDFLPRLRRSS